jgi:hypothetical protein
MLAGAIERLHLNPAWAREFWQAVSERALQQ